MPSRVEQVLQQVGGVLLRRGRDDLAERVHAAASRATRPLTVVCVVGEFKQGKSQLVNALLSRTVCPVDDDLATAVVTVVRHASEPFVDVHLRQEGRPVSRRIEPSELRAWVTEQGNPNNERGVEQVVIGIDHPVLARGLALVDTPGVGGLGGGAAAATTAFLPYADALLFVTDTSAELSAPELEFLRAARERCPSVVVAASKTDLYPSWRRIVDLNRQHLSTIDAEIDVVPVSAAAAIAGLRTRDAELARSSNIPRLQQHLVERVLDRSRDRATRQAIAEVDGIVAHLVAATRQELELLQDPTRLAEATAVYEGAAAHLQTLKGASARWQQVLSDRMSDLSTRVTFRFRSGLRDLGRTMDERIEELATPQEWDELAEQLQRETADLLGGVFGGLDEGVEAVRTELAELLDDDLAMTISPDPTPGDDITALAMPAVDRPGEHSTARKVASGTVSAMRGAQSGLYVFGFLARVVPAGAAALLFSNPITLVLGAAFAGKQVASVRRTNLLQRRQQARSAVRSFLDDVQFEVSNRLTEMIRERQRGLRDETAARVSELQRTYRDLAAAAKDDASQVYDDQAERVTGLRDEIASLEQLRRDLAGATNDEGSS